MVISIDGWLDIVFWRKKRFVNLGDVILGPQIVILEKGIKKWWHIEGFKNGDTTTFHMDWEDME